MTADDEDVRLAIYRRFAATGGAPHVNGLASSLVIDASAARESLRRLASSHHVVLDDDDRIVMAHPFAAIPMGFSRVVGIKAASIGATCGANRRTPPHISATSVSTAPSGGGRDACEFGVRQIATS